jgi:hypothetical protein
MNKQFYKDNAPLLCIMAVTAAGITIAGFLFHQSFFRILPLYISLIIALLQSRMIRYASLIGGINSILYALVYAHYPLTHYAFPAPYRSSLSSVGVKSPGVSRLFSAS